MAVSVDGALFRVPGHLGVGRPSIYTTALGAGDPPHLPEGDLGLGAPRAHQRVARFPAHCSFHRAVRDWHSAGDSAVAKRHISFAGTIDFKAAISASKVLTRVSCSCERSSILRC
jgi:hypothetical protein